jgi:hypothetical protein
MSLPEKIRLRVTVDVTPQIAREVIDLKRMRDMMREGRESTYNFWWVDGLVLTTDNLVDCERLELEDEERGMVKP